MRKFILTIILLLSVSPISNAQWEKINSFENTIVSDIEFINDTTGWISTWRGLLKTEDGGETWYKLIVNIWGFDNIEFINQKNGWAITDHSIYKSDDGGITWDVSGSTDNSAQDIYVINDRIIYVAEWRRILKTSDGGKNWNYIYEDDNSTDISSIYFCNADTGIVTGSKNGGGIILRTFNGGNTWITSTDKDIINIDNVRFLDDSTGYFIAFDKDYNGSINFTSDFCNTWSKITDDSMNIQSFEIIDYQNICAANEDSLLGNQIMLSTDGGFNWVMNDITHRWQEFQIRFSSKDVGFIISTIGSGFGGSLGNMFYKTTDGGSNWKLIHLTYPLQVIYFHNQNIGYIAGGVSGWHEGYGDVFKTEDGGNSWLNSFHSIYQVNSAFFFNSDHGFIITNQTKTGSFTNIYKSTNGGISWDEVYSDSGDSSSFFFSGNEINFVNENIGWVAGSASDNDSSGAAFLHTVDGGSTWDVLWIKKDHDYYNYKISSSFFLEYALGWAVGESGLIVKFSEDNWQIQKEVTDLPLKDVFFSDKLHGWISGGYVNEHDFQSTTLKTSDGGINWKIIKNSTYLINDMFFKDSLNGFAVGSDTCRNYLAGSWQSNIGRGVLLKSDDGGENWEILMCDSSGALTSIQFKNGYGWAAGESGLVLKTSDGINWVDQNSGISYTTKYTLYQNYPNPFNPVTTINYEIPKTSNVDLSVYNLLGEKVVTLVSKTQSAGSYNVEWDATGFASGVYIFKIETENGFKQSKKLVLLK